MTNFDRWRDPYPFEDIANMVSSSQDCDCCPARDYLGGQMPGGSAYSCYYCFYAWAVAHYPRLRYTVLKGTYSSDCNFTRWLSALTVADLADWISSHQDCDNCPAHDYCGASPCCSKCACYYAVVGWAWAEHRFDSFGVSEFSGEESPDGYALSTEGGAA